MVRKDNLSMDEEERQDRDLVYGQISDAVSAAVAAFPGVELVAPEGVQSFLSGLSPVRGKKGVPGIMMRTDKNGLVLDISVAVPLTERIMDTGRALQNAVWESVQDISESIRAINVDILKVKK